MQMCRLINWRCARWFCWQLGRTGKQRKVNYNNEKDFPNFNFYKNEMSVLCLLFIVHLYQFNLLLTHCVVATVVVGVFSQRYSHPYRLATTATNISLSHCRRRLYSRAVCRHNRFSESTNTPAISWQFSTALSRKSLLIEAKRL